MGRKNVSPPFDRLRANGFDSESMKDLPFVLSLSKHERRLSGTSHLGKLYVVSRDLPRRVDGAGIGVWGARDIERGEGAGVRYHERREQHEEYHQDENPETFHERSS